MTRPTVFNYQDYECLKEENLKLKEQIANLEIRCRIAEADMPAWISVSEKLPKTGQNVLLCSNDCKVFVGHRCKPDLIWMVTEEDGRKHWVYDPESYTDDVEVLPKSEDISFDPDQTYADGMLSVTSENYDPRFGGVIAWMPLPDPYKEEQS